MDNIQVDFDKKKLGKRMKQARVRAGMTQSEVAEELDISITTLSRYENASLTPKVETLANFSKLIHINLNNFFDDFVEDGYNLIIDYDEHLSRLIHIASNLDIETLKILVVVAEKMQK